MLVISRKSGEAIFIGPDISVQIIRVQGEKVRIGIEAPKELNIRRDEAPKPDRLTYPPENE